MENREEMRMTINQEIAAVIDAKYSLDDQIALLRQKDAKPEEWAEFNAFAEEVKARVKESHKDDQGGDE